MIYHMNLCKRDWHIKNNYVLYYIVNGIIIPNPVCSIVPHMNNIYVCCVRRISLFCWFAVLWRVWSDLFGIICNICGIIIIKELIACIMPSWMANQCRKQFRQVAECYANNLFRIVIFKIYNITRNKLMTELDTKYLSAQIVFGRTIYYQSSLFTFTLWLGCDCTACDLSRLHECSYFPLFVTFSYSIV